MTFSNEYQTWCWINNRELNILVSYEISASRETYGADYDGNRGQKAYFFDSAIFSVFDLSGHDITAKLKAKYPSAYQSIEQEIETERFEHEVNQI